MQINDKQKEIVDAYKKVFRSNLGKIILDDLMSFCGYDKTSVCESDPNPYNTMFMEGKRRVVLRINSYLKEKTNE